MIASRLLSFVSAVSLLGALAASRAAAEVDVEVPLALAAKGTLFADHEIDTYRFRATNGTVVGLQLVAAKHAQLTFSVHLFDPNGPEVAIPAGLVTTTAKKLAVAKLPLTVTGLYRLEVSATGTGEYSLILTGKAAAKFSGTLAVPSAGTAPFAFSAPPGSRVTLSAKAAIASPATPHFGTLHGDGVSLDLSGIGTSKSNSHTVVVAAIGGAGDFSVDVNDAGPAGDVAVLATVKPKKLKTSKLDTRGAARGHPQGGESVVARVIGGNGGEVGVSDLSSDIALAGVLVPPGALDHDATITVASAPPLTQESGDQAAGSAVFFGPSGLTFAVPVEVHIPYDPAEIPVGQTPQDLRVLVVEQNGSSAILAPFAVDEQGQFVSVHANGFSSCVAVAKTGQQPLGIRKGGDEYWLVTAHGTVVKNPAMDSRSRSFKVEVGEATFLSGGVFQVASSNRKFEYDNATSVSGNELVGNLTISSSPNSLSAPWSYGTDGQTVVVQGDGGPLTLTTSIDGNFILGRGDESADEEAEVDLLLRKNKSPFAAADLAGKYHLVFWEMSAEDDGDIGVKAKSTRLVGTAVFDAAGQVTLTGAQRETDLTGDGSATSSSAAFSASGSFVFEPAGTVVVTLPPKGQGTGSVFRLYPGPAGAVLIGTDKDPNAKADLRILVLVRLGTNLGNATVAGDYRGVDFDTQLDPYRVSTMDQGPGIPVADFQLTDERLDLTFSGTGSLAIVETKHGVQRNTSVTDGVEITAVTKPLVTVSSKIDKTGTWTVTVPGGVGPAGAVTPDGIFGCGVSAVVGGDEGNSLVFFVKLPPAK